MRLSRLGLRASALVIVLAAAALSASARARAAGDTQPPVLAGPQVSPNVVRAWGGLITPSVSVTDNVGVQFVRINVTRPDGIIEEVQMAQGSGTATSAVWNGYWYPPPNYLASPQTYTVSFLARDRDGNESSSATVTFTQAAAKPEDPYIVFTTVPAFGSFGSVFGRVYNVVPADWKVAIIIFVPSLGHYSKPYYTMPAVPIQADGTFGANVTTGGLDIEAVRYYAYLVPASYSVPLAGGTGAPPLELDRDAAAKAVVHRVNPARSTFTFSGIEFEKKVSSGRVFPGPNFFSESGENCFVDSAGRLHLRITKRGGNWYCPEVYALRPKGHGRYIVYLDGPLDSYDANVAGGAFLYGDDPGPDGGHREIDGEIWKFGRASTNYQWVVQPYAVPGNLLPWSMPAVSQAVLMFDWYKDRIEFKAVAGADPFSLDPAAINRAEYRGNVPLSLDEVLRFNLWLLAPPTDGREAELIVRKVEFQSFSTDTQAPGVGSPTATPQVLPRAGGKASVRVSLTDNAGIFAAEAKISGPNGAFQRVPLQLLDGGVTNGIYGGEFALPANPGSSSRRFSCVCYARDASQNFAQSAATEIIVAGAPPPGPYGLGVSAVSNSSLKLTWSHDNPAETAFKIERKVSGGIFGQIGTTTTNVTTFLDERLTANTTYTYRVQATNEGGDGAYSNEASGTTEPDPSITVLSPNGGEAWAVGSMQTLRWTSRGVGGEVRVEWSSNGGAAWFIIAAATANDGSENWTVPNTLTAGARVRVSDATGTLIDTSDGPFTIKERISPASLSVGSAVLAANGTTTLPIRLASNGDSIAAILTDLIFPADKLQFVGVTRGVLPAGVDVVASENGTGRVILLWFGAASVAPFADGVIATLTFRAVSGISPGTTASVQLVMPGSSAPGAQVSSPEGLSGQASTSSGTVTFGRRGDLNGNGIDLGDIQIMVNVLLGKVAFDAAIHDLDGNGGPSAGDLVIEVRLYLGLPTSSAPRRGAASLGRARALRWNFGTGTEQISALAFDLDLGGGTLETIAIGLTRSDLQLATNALPSGRVRVLLYSLNATPIPSTAGLFRIRTRGGRVAKPMRPDTSSVGADGARPDGTTLVVPYRRRARPRVLGIG